jgi:hypothetical protein
MVVGMNPDRAIRRHIDFGRVASAACCRDV